MHKLITITALIFTCIFCAVWQQTQIIKTGKILSLEEKNIEDLKLRNRVLEIKIANLKSLDRIETISKQELGLCRAQEYRVVYLKPEDLKRVASLPEMVTPKANMFAKLFRKFENIAEAETLE